MNGAPTGWTLAYYGGWMAALAGSFVVPAHCLVRQASGPQSADEGWSLGVILGVVFGMIAAYATRDSLAVHRALRWLGCFLCVAGGAVFLLADAGSRKPGFLSGLVESVFALLALLVAAVGGCAWLDGASGPRLVGTRTTTAGPAGPPV